MSESGVILLHDTNEFKDDFGVAKFWHEVREEFPSFEFLHGHGLGVIAAGAEIPVELIQLFQIKQDPRLEGAVRAAYARLGRGISDKLETQNLHSDIVNFRQEIANLRKEIEARDREIEARDREIGDRGRAIDDQDREIEDRGREIEARGREIEDRGREIEEYRAQTERLEHYGHSVTDRLAQVEKERDQILSSKSWRMTAPLRFMSSQFGPKSSSMGASFARLAGWGGLMKRRERRAFRAIVRSGLFDSEWYLSTNPEVARSPRGALLHFIRYGAKQGLRPNPSFDTNWYVKTNPDVAQSGINPLEHYVRFGAKEGRNPNQYSDGDLRQARNRDSRKYWEHGRHWHAGNGGSV